MVNYKLKSLLIVILFISACSETQDTYTEEIKSHQDELNEFYSNSETSPLKPEELKAFKGHAFFDINPAFKVMAYFEKNENPDTVWMPTSSEKIKSFDAYGTASFIINGKPYKLTLYQSHYSRNIEECKNDLFLPFKDMTSGKSTYGGGRYIDLKIPKGDSLLIDFNFSYHPYCAYTKGYSCPVPPAENQLALPIEAGIKLSDNVTAHKLNNKQVEYQKLLLAKPIFDSFDMDGSFIWYDLKQDSLWVYGDSLIYQRQSPASTFKILNSIIVLQEGILKDSTEEIAWDGKKRGWDKWDQNQNLATGIHYSALWAFQEMARRVHLKDSNTYQKYLDLIDFGNKKIGAPDAFWVDNSLQISPLEQLTFLKQLYAENLPFEKNHIQLVKELIKVKQINECQMSGKTGWALVGSKNTGWYIGYVIAKDNVFFYVTTVSPRHVIQDNSFRNRYVGITEALINKLTLDIF